MKRRLSLFLETNRLGTNNCGNEPRPTGLIESELSLKEENYIIPRDIVLTAAVQQAKQHLILGTWENSATRSCSLLSSI